MKSDLKNAVVFGVGLIIGISVGEFVMRKVRGLLANGI